MLADVEQALPINVASAGVSVDVLEPSIYTAPCLPGVAKLGKSRAAPHLLEYMLIVSKTSIRPFTELLLGPYY